MKDIENLRLKVMNGIYGMKTGSFQNVFYIKDTDAHLRHINDILISVNDSMEKCNYLISIKNDIFIKRSLLDCFNDGQTFCFYERDNIEHIKISNIDFTNVIFKEHTFKNVIFENCVFDRVYLFASDVITVEFHDCNIHEILMYKSTFDDIKFYNTNADKFIYIESNITFPIEFDSKSSINIIFMYANNIAFKLRASTNFNVKNIYSFYDVYYLNEVLDSELFMLRNVRSYDLVQCNYVYNDKLYMVDDVFFERLLDMYIMFFKTTFIVYNTLSDLKVWSLFKNMLKIIDDFDSFCQSSQPIVVCNGIGFFDESEDNADITPENLTKFLEYLNSNDKFIDDEEMLYQMRLYVARCDDKI